MLVSISSGLCGLVGVVIVRRIWYCAETQVKLDPRLDLHLTLYMLNFCDELWKHIYFIQLWIKWP